jgi:hypothetical protein
VGFTTRYLRKRLRERRNRALEELSPPRPAIAIEDLPAAGQRWKRNPDGSWMRWSYLGEEWDPEQAPQALLDAAERNLADDEWTRDPDGTWRPTHGEKTSAEETPKAPIAPPEQPTPKAEDTHRPEWTSDWNPEWKEPFS